MHLTDAPSELRGRTLDKPNPAAPQGHSFVTTRTYRPRSVD
jgi:hypothetical protein